MQKRGKKLLALLLALALTAAAAGCSGGEGERESSSSESSHVSAQIGETEVEDGSVPLVEETTTLSVFGMTNVLALQSCKTDYNDLPFFQELEERTNVHIDWIIPASGTEAEQMNLMFSSGDLPDLVNGPTYSDGLDAAVDDGFLLDLTDLLPIYAPHYLAAVEAHGKTGLREAKTDADRYVVMAGVQVITQPPWQGWMVRSDWLEDLGLEAPVTYDDWEHVLTAFRDEKGASAPLTMNPDINWALGGGMGAYGEWYNLDGEARYGMVDDVEATKEYLALMNRWFSEGLIDPNFATNTAANFDNTLVTNGVSGMFYIGYTAPSNNFRPSMEEGAKFLALTQPKTSPDQEIKWNSGFSQTLFSGYAVSTDCENPELAIRWYNYLFTEDGSKLAQFGIEGENYTLDEEGIPQFEDFMLEDFNNNMAKYTMPPGMPCYQDYRRELQAVPEEDGAMMNVWAQDTEDYNWPNFITWTSEEGAEYAQLYTDIETYADESILQFITGARSIDDYENFVQTLKDMGIDRCKEIQQAALDRYLAR